MADGLRYDAFISYSHAADGRLAPALQSALQRLAKPWFRLPTVRVFRDQTSLAATPGLWTEIERQLAQCRHLVLMASDASARSVWVGREVQWWLDHCSPQRLLICVTDGEIVWDGVERDFDWQRTTCLPQLLARRFDEEPLFVDLRWARQRNDLSLRHARFRAAVLDLAAPIHGRPKDALDSDDIREHRRQRAAGIAATTTIALLAVGAGIAAWRAVVNERRAVEASAIASARQLAAEAQLGVREGRLADAALLALRAQSGADTAESRAALLQAVQASWDYRGLIAGAGAAVEALAWSPDGASLLGWGRALGLQRWDPARRSAAGAAWRPSGDTPTAAAFANGGALLATGGADGRVRMWNTTTRREVAAGAEPAAAAAVSALAFDAEARRIAVGLSDGSIAVLQIAGVQLADTGIRLAMPATLSHEASVGGLAFSADGRYLAAANVNPSALVGVWSLPAGRLVGSYSPSTSTWVNVAVGMAQSAAADASRDAPAADLAIGTSAGALLLLRERSRGRFDTVRSLQPHQAAVSALALRDGAWASGSSDGSVAMAAAPELPVAAPAMWTRAPVRSLAYAPDGRTLAVGTADGMVLLLDAQLQRPRALDALPFAPAVDTGTAADGRPTPGGGLRFTRTAGRLLTWRPGTPRSAAATIPLPKLDDDDDRHDIVWSADDRWVVVAGSAGHTLWRADAPTPAAEQLPQPPLFSPTFSPDGRWLAYTARDRRGHVWDLAALRAVHSGAAPAQGGWVFDADSKRLAWITADGTLRLLELTQQSPPLQRAMPLPPSQLVALSPGGRWLFAAGDGGIVHQHDLQAAAAAPVRLPGGLIGTGIGHAIFVGSGGELLLDAGGDLLRWQPAERRVVARMAGHGSALRDAAVSPDGRLIASVDASGSLIVWDTASQRRLTDPLIGGGEFDDTRFFVRFTSDGRWLETNSGRLPMHPATWIADLCGRLLPQGTPECVTGAAAPR